MTQTIEVTLVTGWGCKPCGKVKARLTHLARDFPELRVREVNIVSEEGEALAIRYRLGGLPGILVNGRMTLFGDVPEALLRERFELARQSATPQA